MLVQATGDRKPTSSKPTNGSGTGWMDLVQIGLEIIT